MTALREVLGLVARAREGEWVVNDARLLTRGNRMLRVMAGGLGLARFNVAIDDRDNAAAVVASIAFLRTHGEAMEAVIEAAREAHAQFLAYVETLEGIETGPCEGSDNPFEHELGVLDRRFNNLRAALAAWDQKEGNAK